MRRFTSLSVLGICAAAIVSFGVASAGTRTYVSLPGRDDALPKLGRPGIAVRVDAFWAGAAASAAAELRRELGEQVDTRRLAQGEPGDYALVVTLEEPRAEDGAETVRFTALLTSARGERLWRVEGRSDIEDAPLDAAVYAGISRNVVSALVHDGWVQPRYDPDNPPPPPPTVRNADARR